jgi:serine/threonine-protein kinase
MGVLAPNLRRLVGACEPTIIGDRCVLAKAFGAQYFVSVPLSDRDEHDPVLSAAPPAGTIIAGKYRVERVLGTGGMGVVVAAHHLQLDTTVAIKFLLHGAVKGPDAIARFKREARAAVKIGNEHVARVFDVGTLDTGDPYIVMEYLEGADLATMLGNQGPLSIELAVECLLQACEALAEAHALGIVHRDLKPANLFCVRRPDDLPWIKVLDFGISKVESRDSSSSWMALTDVRAVMGSPFYMSPEQMQAARLADARSDIWALGVILHELLSGQSPFYAESLPQVFANIAMSPPSDLRQTRPDCPVALERVVLRCLEKVPANRYGNVGDLALALAPFGPPRAQASVERIARTAHKAIALQAPMGPSADPTPVSAPSGPVQTSAALGHTKPGQTVRRRPLVAAFVVVGAIGILGVMVLAAMSARRNDSTPAVAPASPGAWTASSVTSTVSSPAAPPTRPEDSRAVLEPPSAAGSVSAAQSASGSTAPPSPASQVRKTPRPTRPPASTAPAREDVY